MPMPGDLSVNGSVLDASAVADVPTRIWDEPGEVSDRALSPPGFVERKTVDWGRVRILLSLSEQSNHWANFGPVTRALESFLGRLFQLPDNRTVVMCSSGTSALYALAGVHQSKSGRPLRLLGSAYGFFSTTIGPLAEIAIMDCAEDGMLDLNAVGKLDVGSYDGLLITNLFGMRREVSDYREFCRNRGKLLLLDNATAFGGYDRGAPDLPDEILSFHHTKPWGIGEGGCAILDREDESVFRSLLNFGIGATREVARFAGNGKMSDYAAAVILERLERCHLWAGLYQVQFRRIRGLAESAGIVPFGDVPAGHISAHVPVQAPKPVAIEKLRRLPIPVGKYYRPLAERAPVAARLFSHMVNAASHPDMKDLSDDVISRSFQRIAAGEA
jgi:dTDP-4-amino-4,6-dideoxygalactose transaminase